MGIYDPQPQHVWYPPQGGWYDPWGYRRPYYPRPYMPPSWPADRTFPVTPQPAVPPVQPIPEDKIRKIVREEIADLLPIDVPDHPPEDDSAAS